MYVSRTRRHTNSPPAARGFDTCVEACKRTRQVVGCDQATTLAGKIGDTTWLLTQQAGQGTPKTFVALLVFWLTLLFASFGLFAPRNLISEVTLTLCAVAVAGAIGMILELERGFEGLVHISSHPMHQNRQYIAHRTPS